MKFHPLTGPEAETGLLQEEYAAAREIGSVRLGKIRFYFRVRSRVYYLSYEAIGRAFRRVELVNARMCCGKGNFEVENIVLCDRNETELAQIQLPGARAGKILLEELAGLAPHCAIGKKSAEQEDAP